MSDDTGDMIGRTATPTRYLGDNGREKIDEIRDSMSDPEFAAHCKACALKYERALDDARSVHDADKGAFYGQMARHVEVGDVPDPRSERPGFTPYVRQAIPSPLPLPDLQVLDHGYAKLIETWGGGTARIPGAGIVEAARQSTQGTFRGWARDRRLLGYMKENRHDTPFEFAGMVLEVRAPIFVFRQWHRHRLFSINELSGRYGMVPALWYLPTRERVLEGAEPTDNRQASGTGASLTVRSAQLYLESLEAQCQTFQRGYELDLDAGVPKELARLGMPVNYYSQMRVSCNVRGWLHFLSLRLDEHAQWEIRQYAEAVATIIASEMPDVWEIVSQGMQRTSELEERCRVLELEILGHREGGS